MRAVTFCLLICVPHDTNQPSYDPGLTSRCGWSAKQTPPFCKALVWRIRLVNSHCQSVNVIE